MDRWFRLVHIFSFCLLSVTSKEIPSYLHLCKRNDPEVSACIKNSVEDLRPKLIEGIPELNTPPIEPLSIDESISTTGSGLTVTTKDLKAHGGGNFTIVDLQADLDNHIYKFKLGFDHLKIYGNYLVDGKIMMITIKGDGDLVCDVYGVDADIVMYSEVINADGIDQLHIKSMDVDVNVAKGKIQLNNLFGGDKLIGETINAAINLNFPYFIKELRPVISQTLNIFILKTANNILEGLPYDQLFSDN